jgi:DNA-3-methyladenine glycosylase I
VDEAAVSVRDLDPEADGEWLAVYLEEEWTGPLQARGGEVFDARTLPALIAERGSRRVGLLCYRDEGDGSWELALLSAEPGHTGVGTALVDALVRRVGSGGLIWLVTTNDNVDALRFYQRRGFRLRALRPGAVNEARRLLKSQIPATGVYGIELRDELELELVVT